MKQDFASPKAIVLNVKLNLSFSGDRYEQNQARIIGHRANYLLRCYWQRVKVQFNQ